MRESSFSKLLRKHLPPQHMRVENLTHFGTPDIYVPMRRVEHFWCETKHFDARKVPDDLGLNKWQKAWMRAHMVPTFIAIQLRDRIVIFKRPKFEMTIQVPVVELDVVAAAANFMMEHYREAI